ncbi:16657_t:CDS:2 [Dentiscutata erythropus]|uniref:16657_t:CDS:1 n=1 Tax=Dentiscutata erythropus TaxID=1348616 RepID=A0A9N8ZX99_9GLOM|nr:16657_t:CDS:2 [Dentiscutata erythropus]
MSILTFIEIFLVLYITYFYFRYFTRPNPLYGPFPLPFIGTLFQIGTNPHNWIEKNIKYSKGNGIWEFYIGHLRVIAIGDAKYLDKIYLSYNESKCLSRESKFFKRSIAASDDIGMIKGTIFNNDFHKWKRNRQFVTKVLLSKKYHLGFIDSVQNLFKEFEKQWDNGVILDFPTWVSHYKTQITVETVIEKLSYSTASIYTISKAAAEYVAMFAFLMFVPKCVSNIVLNLGFRTSKQNSIFLNGTLDHMIQERRDEIANGSTISEEPMDNEEIRINLAEITSTFIETTSSSLYFLIYNVAKNPSILEKIRKEITEIFSSGTNKVVTYENLDKCHYIAALIKEILRHTTPAPYNIRVLEGEENTDKYHWSSGTWFLIDNHQIMNNSIKWNKPRKFNPDRFLSEEHGGTGEFKMRKDDFVPFGGGLRKCPGRNVILIELKLLVVLIYRKYNIDASEIQLEQSPYVTQTIELPPKETPDINENQTTSITASKARKGRKNRFKNPATAAEWDSVAYESSTTWDSATIRNSPNSSDCESVVNNNSISSSRWNNNSAASSEWDSLGSVPNKSYATTYRWSSNGNYNN